MPRAEDLPDELRALSGRQAVEIREAHFHQDAEQLIDVVHNAVHGFSVRPATRSGKWTIAAISCVMGVLILGGLLLFRHSNSHSTAHLGDVAGRWVATVKYDWGDSQTEVFDFEVQGSELSGTASFLGSGRGILDGKIAGDRISFMTKSLTTISSDEQTHEDKHYYRGTVENGAIQFTMLTDSSVESHVPIHFAASRVKAH